MMTLSLHDRHQAKEVAVGEDQATSVEGGTGGGAEEAGGEPGATQAKFTLSAAECSLVRELFAWLVEPCLAFLRREISEMVRINGSRSASCATTSSMLFTYCCTVRVFLPSSLAQWCRNLHG